MMLLFRTELPWMETCSPAITFAPIATVPVQVVQVRGEPALIVKTVTPDDASVVGAVVLFEPSPTVKLVLL